MFGSSDNCGGGGGGGPHDNISALIYQLGAGGGNGGGNRMYQPNLYSTSPHQYQHQQPSSGLAGGGMYTVNAGGENSSGNSYYPPPPPQSNADAAAGYGYMPDTVFSTAIPAQSANGNNNSGSPYGRGRGRGRGGGGRGGNGGGFGRGGAGGGYGRGGAGSANSPPVCDDYEVHDNQLKAPIAVKPNVVVPTAGSNRLFSGPPQPIVYGSRNVFRICEAFQEGRCAAGDKCHDVHIFPDYLNGTRQHMTAWLQSCEAEFNNTLQFDPTHTFRIFVTDLKEVVDVPVTALTFTKGLYVDPTTRARRTRAAHPNGHSGNQNALATQVPTGCGLFAADPTQCKWGRWCNQVHIDPAWMREKKDGFQQWFEKLESDFNGYEPDYLFTVHDPHLKMSLKLPKYSIATFTRGLFQGSNKKAPSACLLFQKGRCTAGSCCNQIHIIPEYLNAVRAVATEHGGDPYGQPITTPAGAELEAISATLRGRHQQQQYDDLPLPLNMGGHGSRGNSSGTSFRSFSGEASGGEWDDYNGALIEHIHVDEDTLDDTNPDSIALMRANNSTNNNPEHEGGGGAITTITPLKTVRHFNQDGSYTNNPYGSVTSIPDGSTSVSSRHLMASGSACVQRGGGGGGSITSVPRTITTTTGVAATDPNNNSISSFSRTPAASLTNPIVKVKTTVRLPSSSGGAGQVSPHVGMPTFLPPGQQRSGGNNYNNMNASTSGSLVGGANGSSSGQWGTGGGGGAYYGGNSSTTNMRNSSTTRLGPYVHAEAAYMSAQQQGGHRHPSGADCNGPLNQSHTGPEYLFTPQDFDSSLHFSPSPLLGFDASNVSATRHPRGEDEFAFSSANPTQRAAGGGGPNSSQSYGGNNSTTTATTGINRGGGASMTSSAAATGGRGYGFNSSVGGSPSSNVPGESGNLNSATNNSNNSAPYAGVDAPYAYMQQQQQQQRQTAMRSASHSNTSQNKANTSTTSVGGMHSHKTASPTQSPTKQQQHQDPSTS